MVEVLTRIYEFLRWCWPSFLRLDLFLDLGNLPLLDDTPSFYEHTYRLASLGLNHKLLLFQILEFHQYQVMNLSKSSALTLKLSFILPTFLL